MKRYAALSAVSLFFITVSVFSAHAHTEKEFTTAINTFKTLLKKNDAKSLADLIKFPLYLNGKTISKEKFIKDAKLFGKLDKKVFLSSDGYLLDDQEMIGNFSNEDYNGRNNLTQYKAVYVIDIEPQGDAGRSMHVCFAKVNGTIMLICVI